MKFDFLMVHAESDTCGRFGCCGAGLDAQIRWNGYPFSGFSCETASGCRWDSHAAETVWNHRNHLSALKKD